MTIKLHIFQKSFGGIIMLVQEDGMEEVISKVNRYCLTLTKSRWLAEDITQETILKAWKMKQSQPNRTMSLTFLYTIAKNLHIDGIRKNREVAVREQEVKVIHHDSPDWEELLRMFCSTLPLKKAMLIALKDVFQYTSLEIAQMLRVREGSIKTALHRAREELNQKDIFTIEADFSRTEQPIATNLIRAMKQHQAHDIFYYYRLMEAQNYSVKCLLKKGSRSIHITDPDGNVLEVVC